MIPEISSSGLVPSGNVPFAQSENVPFTEPHLAAEKLLKLQGIRVLRETIRQMPVASGLWKPKQRRVRHVFRQRDRRSRFGELNQIDGSSAQLV